MTGKYRINLNVKKAGELIINLEILGEDSDMPALVSKATLEGIFYLLIEKILVHLKL